MLSHIFISCLFIKFGSTQVNGEFWWLNDKFANYVGTRPPPPMFEKLSEWDNDENAKIIFRDNSFHKDSSSTYIKNTDQSNHNKIKVINEVSNHNIIRWPEEKSYMKSSIPQQLTEDQIDAAPTGDQLTFQFPTNNNEPTWKNVIRTTTQTSFKSGTQENHFNMSTNNNTISYSDKISFAMNFKDKVSENVCTYMKKNDCNQNKGFFEMKNENKYNIDRQLVCCTLPMKNKNEIVLQKIVYPDDRKQIKRVKRSQKKGEPQRNILLSRNYPRKPQKTKPTTKKPDDDYENEDPYANIKNHKFQNNKKQELNKKNEYNVYDYHDDYDVEIPAPGLTGLYSDLNDNKDNTYDEPLDYESEDPTNFGYSTIDPRIGNNKQITPINKKNKYTKLTTASDENDDVESQTISYHSDPNFYVLQAFKLPYLTRKKVAKVTRSTTTESFSNTENDEPQNVELPDNESVKVKDECVRQIFRGCGNSTTPLRILSKGREIGETLRGSHPWLAILVPTRKENKLLCYASVIHPRAAITAGDCVHGIPAGEITILTGLWNLTERSKSGKRIVSTVLHPKYKSGKLKNNLALLHWKRPLKLGANIQPICLANPVLNQECTFVGWGGFDQAIRPESRWQRATIHTCADHTSLIEMIIPAVAFCASVQARSTVTGIGGSLVCEVDGLLSAVGVAVSRDSTLILLPIYDWITLPNIDTFIGPSKS